MIKLPESSNKFMINDSGVHYRSTVVGSNYVDQGFRIINYSSWCANQLLETKEF